MDNNLIDLLRVLYNRRRSKDYIEKFSPQLKNMMRIPAPMGMIAVFIEIFFQKTYLACWVGLAAWMIECFTLTAIIYEGYKNIYPAIRVKKTRILPFFFKWLYKSEIIPGCLIIHAMFMIVSFVFFSGLCLIEGILKIGLYSWSVFGGYIITGIIMLLYVNYGLYLKIFMQRFKYINRYNVRYLLIPTYNATLKWPTSKVLGKCKIKNFTKKKGKVYVHVELLESEQSYFDVLVEGELNTKKTYKLHEICYVKYII